MRIRGTNPFLIAAAFAIACAVAGLVLLKRPTPPDAAPPTAKVAPQPEPAQPGDNALPVVPPEEPLPVPVQTPAPAPTSPVIRSAPPSAKPAKAAGAALPGAQTPKEPLKDPIAREALALVGLDPGAEEYWYAAINDPDLSAHERQDLIEDLNEDGLSDPKHPGLEDLPVLLRRIRLIEAGWPYAMDKVNADAFQEAYKDLVNLANLALGSGEAVR